MEIITSDYASRCKFGDLEVRTLFKTTYKSEYDSERIYIKTESMVQSSKLDEVMPTVRLDPRDSRFNIVYFPSESYREEFLASFINAVDLSTGQGCHFFNTIDVEPLYNAALYENKNDVPKKNKD